MEGWRSSGRPAVIGARLNTLRDSREAILSALRQAGLAPEPVVWCEAAVTVPAAQRRALTESPLVDDGRVYPQNLASMLPPLLLGAAPGMEVLDLAAAPGSKTLQLAAAMDNRGRLAAVERSKPRFHKLRANCRRAGAECVRFYLRDGTAVGGATGERFDRVLVDAPCSAEARISVQDPGSAMDWGERKIRRLAGLQRRLLESGFQALRPGGLLVYSTCTFAPEENEAVVDALLRRAGGRAALLPIELPLDNLQPGLREWAGTPFAAELALTRRVLPNAAMEGFYLALLRKTA